MLHIGEQEGAQARHSPVIGVLNAAVGAYYYLRIVVTMYLKPARQEVQTTGGLPVALAVAALPWARSSSASSRAPSTGPPAPPPWPPSTTRYLPAPLPPRNSIPPSRLAPCQVHN